MNIKDTVDHTCTPDKDLTNKDKRALNKKTAHLRGRGFDYSNINAKYWSEQFKDNIVIKSVK